MTHKARVAMAYKRVINPGSGVKQIEKAKAARAAAREARKREAMMLEEENAAT
jgi:hypothetical protein